jgi:hypothetical protein
MSKRTRWPGLFPATRRFLWGEARQPKVSGSDLTDSNVAGSTSYANMDPDYKWFRVDSLVRRCLLSNAYFATMAAGFDTVLEATDNTLTPEEQDSTVKKYADIKAGIDAVNAHVDMDSILFRAQLKRSIYGKAGFEIVPGKDDLPEWLLPLSSIKLKPKINKKTWALEGYTYGNISEVKYQSEELLYFTNIQLDADMVGLSDIEPIRDICNARYEILHENFPEIVRTLWAPYVILQADTTGMSDTEEDTFITNLGTMARSGKSISLNKSITATIVDMKADIAGLNQMLQDLKEEIIGNFGTPRLLLGRPIENRATAYAELEAYRDGIIAFQQRSLKRAVEAQWYDPLTKKLLKEQGFTVAENEQPPVTVKHQWRKVTVRDMLEMAQAVNFLWSNSMGPFPDNRDKLWEMMGWDPAEFKEEGEGAGT